MSADFSRAGLQVSTAHNRVKEVKGERLVNPQVTPVSSYVLGVYFFGTGECHDSLYDAKPL